MRSDWRWENEAVRALAQLVGRPEAEIRAELGAIQDDAAEERPDRFRLGRRYERCYLVVREGTVVEVHAGHAGHGTDQRARPSREHRQLAHRLQALGVTISSAEVRDLPLDDRLAASAWVEAAEAGEARVLPGFLRARRRG